VLTEITTELIQQISQLEPFGIGNPQPVIKCKNLEVVKIQKMGTDRQHEKLDLGDNKGLTMQFLLFNAPDPNITNIGSHVSVCFYPTINEWRGRTSVEGQILHIEQKE
jgi:single-stranded-DNA-specific exonuclease